MDFSEIWQNIMNFVSDNTILLIGICVFLILVLIGYLVDNSVKSKRIRKDIKNADQVPENIKEEIIKKAKENSEETKNVEEVKEENISENKVNVENENNSSEITLNTTENNEVNNDNISNDLNLSVNLQNDALDSSLNLNSQNISEDKDIQNNNDPLLNIDLNLDNSLDNIESNTNNILEFNVDSNVNFNNLQQDPDSFIMGAMVNNNEYKNDKKLSEILSLSNTLNTPNANLDSDIILDNNINRNNIENNKPQDELESIMQKLSSQKNEEEDNYTNIF